MDKKRNRGALIGAAFIMATSAIGPGFLTQTAKFTDLYGASFGFVVLVAVVLALVVQLNIWPVLTSSGLRGQDVANKVFFGLGYLLTALIVLGGLVFNIGNVGGGALGFNTLLGIPTIWGYFLAGGIAILIFLFKNAMAAMDNFTKILGGLMIAVIFIVILIVNPPYGEALKATVVPDVPYGELFSPILTLLGGTVGGYITFAGAHRLIDAGFTGKDSLTHVKKSAMTGISIATIVRIFLFLAILGVVSKGVTLEPTNPAADAFKQGAGEIGYRFFGLVLLSAALTSIVGAAYTSVSFLKTLIPMVAKHEKSVTIAFIIVSTCIMAFVGQPANLLVLAGALNGLILPLTLGICLVASQKTSIVGPDYKHPKWLLIAGIIVVIATAYLGFQSLGTLGQLFA